MCGIVGAIARPGRFDAADIERAVRSMRHRGPDDLGVDRVMSTDAWEVWLGHARLAIVDTSSAGHQPMRAADAAIAFNGEVYNHRELRSQLPTETVLRSTSDTEVLLAGLLEHGAGYLRRTNGMLALGLWDDRRKHLLLARDRLGKKPLYIYEAGDVLAFASELKAFHALGLHLTEDPEAWAYYHWLRHIPAGKTIYRECGKFPAGCFAQVSLPAVGPLAAVSPKQFWDPLAACGRTYLKSYDTALDEFAELLDDATRIRLDADVPVGIFLSAGIDSSLVAASVAAQHNRAVTAYIVKSADPGMDESRTAVRTARQLGLETCVLELRPEDYERQTRDMAYYYDEPCAPLSQIPTMAIAEAARRHVTVVLTGDGGDEIFLGYPWLFYPDRLFRYRRALEVVPGARQLAGRLLPSRLGLAGLWAAARALGLSTENLEVKRSIAIRLMGADRPPELYDAFQELWPRDGLSARDRELLGTGGILARAMRSYPQYSWEAAERRTAPELLGALEMVTSMRDEILVKVDRGTMAHSLEARSPLLDHRIVEFGVSLPLEYKARDGMLKRLLRDACARRVDPTLATRHKSGFGIPPPRGLPPGPTIPVRWGAAVEAAWRERWGSGASAALKPRVSA